MKKNSRSYVCLVLALILLFTFTACSKDEDVTNKIPQESAQKDNSANESEKSDEGKEGDEGSLDKSIEISWFGIGGEHIEDNNIIQKELEEKFNVKLVNYKASAHNTEQMNLMISSGELPDTAQLYKSPKEMWKEGVVRSIPKELILKYAPNYAKMLDAEPMGWLVNSVPNETDEYMCFVGTARNVAGINFVSHYRLDWLENLGFKPKGELEQLDDRVWWSTEAFTLDELDEIFDAFTNKDPDENGADDTFAMSGCDNLIFTWENLMGMYGFTSGYNVEKDGKVAEWYATENYKEFLKKAAEWYEKGYIDPEFVTLNLGKMWEKVTEGKVGRWVGGYGYLSPMYNDRPPFTLLERNPEAKILVTPPEIGSDGTQGTRQYTPVNTLSYYQYVNKDVDDEKLIRILQMFDYINFDDEFKVISLFGKPGEHFDWTGEEWKSAAVPKNLSPEEKGKIGLQYYRLTLYTEDFLKYLDDPVSAPVAEYCRDENKGGKLAISPYKYDYFGETDLDNLGKKYSAELDKIVNEFLYQSITGEISDIDSEWESYIDRLNKAGYDKIIEESEKAPLVEELKKGNIVK